ncbi:hypothetical protein [Bradyrhizobium sp. LTSPM299]|uniref:His-rich protein BRANT n=1 Tax=Bradyrhizobium sp. LTSPM299 TaxID=1619233 RepID=UPI001FDA8F02|nr:hypothetical protein [Bradyrhizobium sp. LTSPM299]
MNEHRQRPSERVQRATPKVASLIGETDHPAGHPAIPVEEETTMLKTISAALIAMSVIAAPALAAEQGKTVAPAPVTKTAPVIKSEQIPSKVLNANAKMGRHHVKHYRHHRHHKHMGVLKVKAPKFATSHVKHIKAKVAVKHVAPVKRG